MVTSRIFSQRDAASPVKAMSLRGRVAMFRTLVWMMRSAIAPRRRHVREPEAEEPWDRYATPFRFRFEVLGDAVFEGMTSVGEVLFLADEVFASEPRDKRQEIAWHAIEQLLSDGLVEIETFEGGTDADQLRHAAHRVIASDDRVGGARLLLQPTPAGVDAAENPPEEIRQLWRLSR